MAKQYNTINIFTQFNYNDYLQKIINIITNYCNKYNYYYVDGYLRLHDRNVAVKRCDLSILLIGDTDNDRYECQSDWLNRHSQHFNKTKTLALIYGEDKDWINYKNYIQFDLQIKILLQTIDDEYNKDRIVNELTKYFINL